MNILRQKNNKNKFAAGFTLVETLVAISILMLAIVSPMTIAQSGLTSAAYSKSEFVAQYLSQDAIEFVKNRRDRNVENLINGDRTATGWLGGLELCTSASGGDESPTKLCKIDTISGGNDIITNFASGDVLKYNSTNNTYNYKNEENSIFTRAISIQSPYVDKNGVEVPDEALITVTTSWSGRTPGSVTIKHFIFRYRS